MVLGLHYHEHMGTVGCRTSSQPESRAYLAIVVLLCYFLVLFCSWISPDIPWVVWMALLCLSLISLFCVSLTHTTLNFVDAPRRRNPLIENKILNLFDFNKKYLNRGFTLIEVAVVAGVLSTLATVSFVSFQNEATISRSKLAEMVSVASGVTAAARAMTADEIVMGRPPLSTHAFPDQVVAGTKASTQQPFFAVYLDPPITHGDWRKLSNTCYQYDTDGDESSGDDTDDLCLYFNPTNGKADLWKIGDNSYCNGTVCNGDVEAFTALKAGSGSGGGSGGSSGGGGDSGSGGSGDSGSGGDSGDDGGSGAKMTICHDPNGKKPATMSVPPSAWPGHQVHGDLLGPCE